MRHDGKLVFFSAIQVSQSHAFQPTRPPDRPPLPSPLRTRNYAWFAQIHLHRGHASRDLGRTLRCNMGLIRPPFSPQLQLESPSTRHSQRGTSKHRSVQGSPGHPWAPMRPHIQEGRKLFSVQVSRSRLTSCPKTVTIKCGTETAPSMTAACSAPAASTQQTIQITMSASSLLSSLEDAVTVGMSRPGGSPSAVHSTHSRRSPPKTFPPSNQRPFSLLPGRIQKLSPVMKYLLSRTILTESPFLRNSTIALAAL